LTWGRRGLTDGRFYKPRAVAIDARDQLYIVDMSGRIQVFTPDGEYLRSWKTPAIETGKPCGLVIDRQGHLLVADTHYFQVLFYTTAGTSLPGRTIGGHFGHEPGQFGFVTDVVQDSAGQYYVSEYGEYDRIQKFDAGGQFLTQWGGHGSAPGEFIQPRGLAIDRHDHVWVADACNHRVQVFDARGETPRLVRSWGRQGSDLGQLRYPYGIALDDQGHVYISEFGNSRVQKFTADGQSLGSWGKPGRRDGELYQPWDLVIDSRGRVHVLDTYNHRVQRIRL
jgi:DNA-binding beta-propeller fold protein YncE